MGLGLGLGINLAARAAGFNVAGLPNYSAAVQATLRNQADTPVIFLGNSTEAGAYNGPTSGAPNGLNGNAAAYSPASVVAQLMAAAAIPANAHTVNGTSRLTTSAAYTDYDNSVTFTGTVAPTTNNALIGGGYFGMTSAGSATIDLVLPCDRLEIATDALTAGTANIKVGGVTQATISATTTTYQTVTLPAGTTSVTIEWVSGDFRWARVCGRSTTVRRVLINRLGQAGRRLDQYITSASPLAVKALITAIQPKLVIVDSYINEATASQTEAVYKAAVQEAITAAKGVGSDVILFAGNFASGTVTPRSSYVTWMSDLVTLNAPGVVLLDLATTSPNWASLAAQVSAGYMAGDQIHLVTAGAASKGAVIADRITP